ncbi:MAG: protein translocase subunit SecDF, partial [Bacteroidota bacterium]|nr:protein translocase subunit SecDF [Bacteroidota bacterium]
MRVLVSIFAALLIIISAYQLSFTWFVNKHESAMDARARTYVNRLYPSAQTKYPGDKEARALYQDTLDQVFNSRKKKLLDSTKDTKITWWGTTYQKSKESELLLGLDLQGGISVTLDVALDALIKGLANNPRDQQVLKAINLANAKKQTRAGNFIDLFAQSYKELYPGSKMAPLFANSNNSNRLKFDASDDAVISYLNEQAVAAMNQTYKVLQLRIDKFGVAQPSISLDANRGIISVELAGATDPDRVRKYLQSTANLQFWEVYNLGELQNPFLTADKSLQNYLNGVKDTGVAKSDSGKLAKADSTKQDSSAVAGPNQNPLLNNRLIRFIPPQQGKNGTPQYSAALAVVNTKDTAKVDEYLALPVVRNNFPQDLKFLWGKQRLDENGKVIPELDLYAIRTIPGKDKAEIEGDAIEDANQDYEPVTGEVIVEMSMKKQGAKKWADMTTKNVGKPIAIVLDDVVYSAPFVNEPITGGNSRITMGGSRN